MYTILPEVYDELAASLSCRIGDGSYFAGTVETLSGDVCVALRATLILYRSRDVRPDGEVSAIADVVPVWWECHTVCGAVEMLNDFDFAELRRRLAASDIR